jgi:hypothetical protein
VFPLFSKQQKYKQKQTNTNWSNTPKLPQSSITIQSGVVAIWLQINTRTKPCQHRKPENQSRCLSPPSLRPLPVPPPHFISQCSLCRACLGFSPLAVARAPVRSVIGCGQANVKTPSVPCLGCCFSMCWSCNGENTAAPMFFPTFPVICFGSLYICLVKIRKNRNLDQDKQFLNRFVFRASWRAGGGVRFL